MAGRYQAIDLTRTFLYSAERLCKSRRKMSARIDKTLTTLMRHPDSSSLHREPLHDTPVDRLWSSRVNGNIRLIDQEQARRRLRALNVGAHDAVYQWCRRYQGSGQEDILDTRVNVEGSAEDDHLAPISVVTEDASWALPTLEDVPHLPVAREGENSFECIPISELRALGLSEAVAKRIALAPDHIDLIGFGVPDELADAIYELYLGRCDPPHVPAPIPQAHRADVITITVPGQFERMMETGLDRYLTLLTDDQRDLAKLEQTGLLVVKGSGGSGKTTVAVHRLKHLADLVIQQPRMLGGGVRRVLYLCYNRVLAETVKEMLVTLYGSEPPRQIEVETISAWVWQYLREHAIVPGQGSAHTRYQLVEWDLTSMVARALARWNQKADRPAIFAQRTHSFFAAEIQQVILGRGIRSLQEYQAIDRRGWTTRLNDADLTHIWHIFEDCQLQLAERHTVAGPELANIALEHVKQNMRFNAYDAVIVDEAQDLTPVQLRLACQLAGAKLSRVTIFADAAQTLYRTGFSWKAAELAPRGRQVRTLTRNHRNTREINDAAQGLLMRGPTPDDPGTYLTPQQPETSGDVPTLLICASEQSEHEELYRRISEQMRSGVPAQNIAVLAGKNDDLSRLANTLESHGIPVQRVVSERRVSLTHPSVKLMTMHSVKGLDFPHVYIAHLTAMGLPGASNSLRGVSHGIDTDTIEVQRRLLYTAMIRSGRTLVLSTLAANPHPLLDDIDEALCRRAYID